jgi:hypothetical protein
MTLDQIRQQENAIGIWLLASEADLTRFHIIEGHSKLVSGAGRPRFVFECSIAKRDSSRIDALATLTIGSRGETASIPVAVSRDDRHVRCSFTISGALVEESTIDFFVEADHSIDRVPLKLFIGTP